MGFSIEKIHFIVKRYFYNVNANAAFLRIGGLETIAN
jgi:hypothetical protein